MTLTPKVCEKVLTQSPPEAAPLLLISRSRISAATQYSPCFMKARTTQARTLHCMVRLVLTPTSYHRALFLFYIELQGGSGRDCPAIRNIVPGPQERKEALDMFMSSRATGERRKKQEGDVQGRTSGGKLVT